MIDKAFILTHESDFPYLTGCIKSLSGVVKKVYLGDTDIESKSLETLYPILGLYKSYFEEVKVIYLGQTSNFAEARNKMLEYANEGEWILQIDSDERVVVEDSRWVKEFGVDGEEGYRVKVSGPHMQKDGRVVNLEEWIFRVFKYRNGIKYKFRVHEQIGHDFVGRGVKELKGLRIVHLGYDIPKGLMDKKVRRNEELILKELLLGGVHSYMLYHLGEMRLWQGDIISALRCYRRALERCEITNPELIKRVEEKVKVLEKRVGGRNE